MLSNLSLVVNLYLPGAGTEGGSGGRSGTLAQGRAPAGRGRRPGGPPRLGSERWERGRLGLGGDG